MTGAYWTEKMQTGVATLDEEHRLVLRLADQLVMAVAAGERREITASILEALAQFAEFHVRREEAILETLNFLELPGHRLSHAQLLGRIAEMRRRPSQSDEGPTVETAAMLLEGWRAHILQIDSRYTEFLALRREQLEQALGDSAPAPLVLSFLVA